MCPRRAIILATAAFWLAGGAGVEAKTVQLSFEPLNRPLHVTIDSTTKIIEGSASAPSWTGSSQRVEEWTFSRNGGQWQVTTVMKSSTSTVNGEAVQDRFQGINRNQPIALQLNEHGQAVSVLGLEQRVEQIRAATGGMTGGATLSPEVIQAGILHNWNAVYGIVWSMVTGRELQLDTPMPFQGQLHVGLSLFHHPLLSIAPVDVNGEVQVSAAPAEGQPERYRVTCTYQREEALDETARARLADAMSKTLPSLAAEVWSKSTLTVKSETTVDAATLLLVEQRVEQQLAVQGEAGASFRVADESRRRATWPQ